MAGGRSRNTGLLSPLRYPGGKRKLAGFIAEAVRMNGLRPKLFVEPFAGGASVSLYLLEQGLVEQIALGEKDELVSAFWKTVFFDHAWLVEQLRQTRPTLEAWLEFRQMEPRSERERALKCLFLNRTSFSGILNDHAGPLGGRNQASRYHIGCRFYLETLVERIERIAALAPRVCFLHHGDWRETVALAQGMGLQKKDLFLYLDPPFYHKAGRLYRYWFDAAGHQTLHDGLPLLTGYFILSYDAAPEIVSLYGDNGSARRITLLYSAASRDTRAAEELIISDLPVLPPP